MNIIKVYLDNMFINLPQTEQVLRAKEELYNMMEDKYNELKAEGKTENEAVGIVISEFGNLEELDLDLGFDNSVNAELDKISYEKQEQNKAEGKSVSLAECKEYIEVMKKSSIKIADAAAMCIMSVVPLLFLAAMSDLNFGLTENMAGAIGITILLIMIAGAVAKFITTGLEMSKYEALQKECIILETAAAVYVRDEYQKENEAFGKKIALGVCLCIVGVVPLIFAGAMGLADYVAVTMLCVLLVCIAVGVTLFIKAGMVHSSYQILLQEGDYTAANKKSEKLIEKIANIYWPVVVCVYLTWSFITGAWGVTWIIWPVTGVGFGVIAAICKAVGENA